MEHQQFSNIHFTNRNVVLNIEGLL